MKLWISILALIVPLTSLAEVTWRADYESGNLSEWDKAQLVSADRMQVVSSPVRSGNKALQVTVKQGDDPINASGNRNELVKLTAEKTGSEWFYGWSTMFRNDFPAPNTWQVFAQWHHDGCCGSPPIEMVINNDKMRLMVQSRVLWEAPLVRSVWHDFILRIKFSPDAKVGFVELFHNNELVLPKTMVATQYPDSTQYLKLGLYRSDTIQPVGVLFHDNFRMATALEDLLPAPTSPPAEEPVVTEPPVEEPPAEEPVEEPVVAEPTPEEVPEPIPGVPGTTPPIIGETSPTVAVPGDMVGTTVPMGCSATGNAAVGGLFSFALMALMLRRRKR